MDERALEQVDEEISLGDFILTGGEPAALVILDAVARLVPGVLGNAASAQDESFGQGLLEYPQYTRPLSFREQEVPQVLRSGDHGRIRRWRRAQALLRTQKRRPDLFARYEMSRADHKALKEFAPVQPGTTGSQNQQTSKTED
jgi:tRNA (guanine37-N1)-methyltransferase